MIRLFRAFILRRLAADPLRSGVTLLGIALGIAVIVAVRLTNASSLNGFRTALDTVAGRTSLEVSSTGPGLDERRLADLGWLRQYGDVAPVIEGHVSFVAPDGTRERLRVLGVDILRDPPFRDYRLIDWAGGGPEPGPATFLSLLLDPSAAVIAAAFAGPRGFAPGSTFDVQAGDRVVRLTVQGVLRDEGPARVLDGRFVLMDIAAAQLALDRLGYIDRVEVRLPEGAKIDEVEDAIAARLPAGLSVARPEARGRQVEQMLAAFHLNLTALSYIALIVGLFLIYNTMAVAVLARREEIGMLRAAGVTCGQVRALFLADAALLATAGTALGVGLGRVLADGTIALTATTVSALYIAAAAAPPALTASDVALAFGAGVPLALLAAFAPARDAARVPPIAAIRGADRVEARARPRRRWRLTALGLLGLGVWLATLGPVGGLPLFGYASAAALVFGAAFLVPDVLDGLVRLLRWPVRRLLNVADWLALTNLAAAVPRLSISVAALAVSLSMLVAIAIMIGSFRQTVIYWVGQTLQADLFVSPGAGEAPGQHGTLSPDVVRHVQLDPDVAAIDRYRLVELPWEGTRIRVAGRDAGVLLSRGGLLLKDAADPAATLRALQEQDAVLVSEALSIRHGFVRGDAVTIDTPAGPARLTIAGVFYDYSSDRGVVLTDHATFERHYGAGAPNGLGVFLRPGVDADVIRARLLAAIGDTRAVFINTNRTLSTEVLRIFDSTFGITWALELIAIIVAILGVAGTLVTLVLEREVDFTTLRRLGAARRQVRRIVVGEALLVGAVAQAVGIVAGVALSVVLIHVINVQSFGWTIQFHLPVAFLAQSSIALLAAAALAGLYPARRALALTGRPLE